MQASNATSDVVVAFEAFSWQANLSLGRESADELNQASDRGAMVVR